MKKTGLGKTLKSLAVAASFLFIFIGHGVSWAADSDGDAMMMPLTTARHCQPLQLDADL